jgi:RNA-dependent RNA polymerase
MPLAMTMTRHYGWLTCKSTMYDVVTYELMWARFNILLDSRKTGHMIKPEVYKKDKRKYDRDPPTCMADTDSYVNHNPNHLRRASHLPKFILDELLFAGRKLVDQYLQKYDKNRPAANNTHISKLHERMESHPGLKEEVQAVKDFVKSCHDRWNQIWVSEKPGVPKSKEKKKQETDEVWQLVVDYMHGPPEEKTSLLRATNSLTAVAASYAYSLAAKFAFTVAFRDICALKATEPGSQISPTTEEMAACFTIPASVARIFDQSNSGTI